MGAKKTGRSAGAARKAARQRRAGGGSEPAAKRSARLRELEGALERLRESEERFASTMALAAIGISHVDDAGRFLYVNPQLCIMLGYTEAELLGLTVRDISHPDDIAATRELSARLRAGTIPSFKVEKRYLRKDGTVMWAGLTVALKRDVGGDKLYDISIIEDISARKAAEQRVQYLASHDPLTGLPNRATFAELLANASSAARRHGRKLAVLFIDLDGFKSINDTLGHEAGDAMLREVGTRLRSSVRASDVVARLGGDEFVVLLPEVGAAADAETVARGILSLVHRPVELAGRSRAISASIGICLHPDGLQEDRAVLKNADTAMYLAKQSGKNRYRVYVNELETLAAERAALAARLAGALERGEFEVRYGVEVDAETGAVGAVEAGVVWRTAEREGIAPGKWLAAAEQAGVLVPISRWALQTACADVVAWQRAGLAPVAVAVDVCRGQVNDETFVAVVREELARCGLEPHRLMLNVTEGVLRPNPGRAALVLEALRSLGVTIALTAFGTGRISFADAKRLPIDSLKVDGARLHGVAVDADKQAYAEGLVLMGDALGLRVVVTGVAAAADAEFLGRCGCAALQGAAYGVSLTAAACAQRLRAPATERVSAGERVAG